MKYHIWKLIGDWAIIGRPSYAGRKKKGRRLEIQEKFGERNWQIVHFVEGKLLSREEAIQHYEDSYYYYLNNHPEILEWLLATAKDVYDTDPTNVNSRLDYTIQETEATHLQDISIRRVIKRLGREFQGEKFLRIRGADSEGFILSPGQVPFYKPEIILKPQLKGWWNKNSIESFWQSNKVLVVKFKTLQKISREMVGIILRSDVRMGRGKFCAQTAHAAVTLLPERNKKWNFSEQPAEIWTIKGEENLAGIYSKARKMKINCSLIRDAGKTQIVAGTMTAVGVGPVNEAIFDALISDFEVKSLSSRERAYRDFKIVELRN